MAGQPIAKHDFAVIFSRFFGRLSRQDIIVVHYSGPKFPVHKAVMNRQIGTWSVYRMVGRLVGLQLFLDLAGIEKAKAQKKSGSEINFTSTFLLTNSAPRLS
ncbi:hypothetical protein [Sinorhizobium fredii]|uniref:hypothetical protein n=1 Tax=Rhizobium fredii TaxID=380 RepID=UPI00138AC3D6